MDENEHDLLYIYKFSKPSQPIRFIRILVTDKNWDNTNYLQFAHFDLFGHITIDETTTKAIINCMESKKICDENIKKEMNDLIEKKSNDDKNVKAQIDEVKKIINDQNNETKKTLEEYQNKKSNFYNVEPSMDSPGLLETLKKNEKTKFDHLFISSQSHNDCYNLIDPKSNESFKTPSTGNCFIGFEFENIIQINGIQIFSSQTNYPKSFDISIDDKIVASIKEANELNGPNQRMTINIEPIPCRKIRIKQTGPNWDINNNRLNIQRIELLSPESQYSEGVFSTLIKNSENEDPHMCPIFINSSSYSHNHFYLMSAPKVVSIVDDKNAWFQIELIKGAAILFGFRLIRYNSCKLRHYKIICTDNIKNPIDSWTTLIEINEKNEDEHKIADIYKFPHHSPLVSVIRIILTGPPWNGEFGLKFFHFDLFGKYF